MTLYSSKPYNAFTYGETSKLVKNIGNFTVTAINYSKVQVSWSNIVGGYSAFRIVRSQEGFSETSEDGVILYEEFGINPSGGSASKSFLVDFNTVSSVSSGVEIIKSAPELLSNRPVFYTAWWLVDGAWSVIGYAFLLLPNQHYSLLPNSRFTVNTHERLLNLLPRIYTSKTNSPLDEIAAPEYDINGSLISQGSDLYFYLKGLSVSLDETLTYIDYLIPDFSGRKTIPSLIKRKLFEVGFSNNSGLDIQRQNDLIKNAIYIYSRKGTLAGLRRYVESATGLPTTINITPNLLLSLDDASFKTTIGNWSGGSITKVAYSSISLTPPLEPYSIELTNCAQITGSATVANGVSSPITTGVPVVPGGKYTFSFYARKTTTTGTALPRIKWFDYKGSLISSSVAASTTTVQSNSWTKVSLTASAPGKSFSVVYAGLISNVVTLGLDQAHTFVVGDSVTVSNVGSVFNGTYTITAVNGSAISYSKTNANILAFEVLPETNAVVTDGSVDLAVYAGLEIDFGAGTYYLDFVQVSDYTITDYYEPRGVNIYLAPKKINYISNPSFEVNGNGWVFSPSGSSQTVTIPAKVLFGSKVYQVTTTSGSPFFGSFTTALNTVSAGKNFVFSIWAKTNNSNSLTYTISLSASLNLKVLSRSIASSVASLTVENTAGLSVGDTVVVSGLPSSYNGTFVITDVSGVNISYSVPGSSNEAWTEQTTDAFVVKTISRNVDVSLTNSWTRPEVNLFVPETWDDFSTKMICKIATKTNAGGEIVYLDAAQLEDGVTASDYFDGSYSWQYGASWVTANNSISYLYPNKAKVINVLSQELPRFLPYETPWLINGITNLEAKGIIQ